MKWCVLLDIRGYFWDRYLNALFHLECFPVWYTFVGLWYQEGYMWHKNLFIPIVFNIESELLSLTWILSVFVTQIYHECGQVSRATEVLEACINKHSSEADLNAFSLLIILLMKNNSHGKALHYIEQAKSIFYSEKELPLYLTVKTGICLLYLGDIENAKVCCCHCEIRIIIMEDNMEKFYAAISFVDYYALLFYSLLWHSLIDARYKIEDVENFSSRIRLWNL